ncbi:MAG: HAMP domain-containing sensor histidine kinase [Lachnospiraceae bacterium]|nr:HAMP domain-containing sensor histidine kinase [Lachnospiraceae bacterium]
MSFWNDRQIRKYWYSMFGFIFLLFILGTGIVMIQTHVVQKLFLSQENAIVTSLMEQGIAEDVIAAAISYTGDSEAGASFLSKIGRTDQTSGIYFPSISKFLHTSQSLMLMTGVLLAILILGGTFLFFRKREQLYQQAAGIISGFTEGDYSRHMPQSEEGMVYRLFALIDQLATMLQSKNETDLKAKEFLKNTISDISHQLKTPLAALTMYQEIIEEEPDNPGVVKEFSGKMSVSLKRMEQLISSLLKITRLDAGNIVFEMKAYQVSELVLRSVSELITRAQNEEKEILMEGPMEDTMICDMEWTSEAIGNIVKNALDHTSAGGKIRITYERSPYMSRIMITDNGQGISYEDIHYIFKRFYRSKNSLNTQGVGLGLPLAKSIIEGQGGTISVKSNPNEGTTFLISMLTKL